MKKVNMKTYRDLVVWQKAMQLVTETYKLTASFPKEEIYALTSQIRRCAVSIPSNIAEGYGRKSTQEYIRFLQVSVGSLYELQTQLQIACNLKYVSESDFEIVFASSRELERMLSSLIGKLREGT
jgi:four helix bundle protein